MDWDPCPLSASAPAFLATRFVPGVHGPPKEASLSSVNTQRPLLWILLINESVQGLMASRQVPAARGTSEEKAASVSHTHFQSSHAEAALARGVYAEPMGKDH